MLQKRPANSIYRYDGSWFEARWHFSFDRYRDPEHMGIGPLRVFNDDTLVESAVWPLHSHRDVEGLSYVVEGRFRHQDDQGNNGELAAGSAQRMTLGKGAWHSEQNASVDEPVRFIQMWILPHTASLVPSCEQRTFTKEHRSDRPLVIFCPDTSIETFAEYAQAAGVPPPIPVHGHAIVAVSSLSACGGFEYRFAAANNATAGYLYSIKGKVVVNTNDEEVSSTRGRDDNF